MAIYSASEDPADMSRSREIGAVDFIQKPCKREELLARIGAIVTQYSALKK
jgi:DNA-binding response OmpR family regulator